jgi:hypothetical protein
LTPVKKRIAHTFNRNLEERGNNDALHPSSSQKTGKSI